MSVGRFGHVGQIVCGATPGVNARPIEEISGTSARILPTPCRANRRNGLLDETVVIIHAASNDLHTVAKEPLHGCRSRPTLEQCSQRGIVHAPSVAGHVVIERGPHRKGTHEQEPCAVSQVAHAALELANLCWCKRRRIVSWIRSPDLAHAWRDRSAAHRDDDAIVNLLTSNEINVTHQPRRSTSARRRRLHAMLVRIPA